MRSQTNRYVNIKNMIQHTENRSRVILKQAITNIGPDAEGIDCDDIENNPELDMLSDIAVSITLAAANQEIGYRPCESDAITYAYYDRIDVMAMDQDGDHVLQFKSIPTTTLDRAMVRHGILTPKFSDKPFHKAISEHPNRFTSCQITSDNNYILTSNRGANYTYNPTTSKLEWNTKSRKAHNYIKPSLFARYFSFLDEQLIPYVKKERTPRPKKEKPEPPKKTLEQIAIHRTKFFTDKIHDTYCTNIIATSDEHTVTVTATTKDGRTATMQHTHKELNTSHQDWTKTAWTTIKENKNPINYT